MIKQPETWQKFRELVIFRKIELPPFRVVFRDEVLQGYLNRDYIHRPLFPIMDTYNGDLLRGNIVLSWKQVFRLWTGDLVEYDLG